MSTSTSMSSPPDPLTSRPPLRSPEDAAAAVEMTRRLRAELASTTDPARQSRLLAEMAEVEERAGDDGAAARDYLAAYDADPTFREPLEGLARLLERRPSLKTLGHLFDALVEAATAPDERVRAFLMRAAYQLDTVGDMAAAEASARDAVAVEGAPVPEQASGWLTLEILAGRTGDALTREDALAERTTYASDPTWRALLLIDRARMAAAVDEVDSSIALLEQARAPKSEGVWTATSLLEEIVRDHPGVGAQARARTDLHAGLLEAVADLVQVAMVDSTRGDALGVPQWVREPGRAVDAWLRAAEARRALGQHEAAASALHRASSLVERMDGNDGRLADAAVTHARIRLAEQTGDTALAAQLAARRLSLESDRPLAAALALRVAEHAASEGDAKSAVDALNHAIGSDPGCLPARALQLDILADGSDPGAFASQLEAFAEHFATDEARGRAFLLAAYVWAVRAHDVSSAKAALSQASILGVTPDLTWRLARLLSGMAGDAAWYEEATKRLLASGSTDAEVVSLHAELIRLRDARGDAGGAARAVRELGETRDGGWIARVIDAFSPRVASSTAGSPARSPTGSGRGRVAVEELAARDPDPTWTASLTVVAAMRAHADGDLAAARQHLHSFFEQAPDDAIVAAYAGDLSRAVGDHDAAAHVASALSLATSDPDLAATARLESAFELWRSGQRKAAVDEMDAALAAAPEAAGLALGWACWGVSPDSLDARRRAIQEAKRAGGNPAVWALELFATEMADGNPGAATAALDAADATDGDTENSIGLAAALARIVGADADTSRQALDGAFARLAREGPRAAHLAAAERVRVAHVADDPEVMARAARAWFEFGGGLAAALEWLTAATVLGDAREEMRARLAATAAFDGDAREAMLASAAMVQTRIDVEKPGPLAEGTGPAIALVNLELAPPGCDPRRRAAVLDALGGTLGDMATLDAAALAGWAHLVAGDLPAALASFERLTKARPADLAAWEGLRLCAGRLGDNGVRANAAAELGARCVDDPRGAAFWEEAALLWLEVEDGARADHALDESFARDPRRAVAFDRMFRRIRDRKDNDRLLTVIARRLDVAEEPEEVKKLFWERARTLREMGDHDGALKVLEHVTLLDANHIGALALLGEINLRRGNFESAAASLAQLAMLDAAPARNRVTAAVAAADIYENKLDRFDLALDVLLSIHRAGLSTLPVRERLARAAARTGAWAEATLILEQLMGERPDAKGRAEAARLAMAIHRDRLGDPQSAAAAIVQLLEEEPADGEALEMLRQTVHEGDQRERLLQHASASLARLLQDRPTDHGLLKRLAAVARDRGDAAVHQIALGVLAAVGAPDAQSEQLFATLAARKQRIPQTSLSEPLLYSLLAPGDHGAVADLFVAIGPTLADALGPSVQACGAGRRDKVDPRSGLALRNEIAAWAGAFGIREFDLYIGGKDPLGIQGVPGEPHALVVGSGVNAPLTPLTRARVARELLAVVRGTTVVRWRDEVTVAAIVVASCKLSDIRVDHPPYAVLADVERLIGKAMARKTRRLLPDLCRAIAARGGDPRAWSKRALATHDRIAAVACGDPSVVLCDVLGVPIERLGQAVAESRRAEELLRFALSQNYLDLRHALGLEGPS